MHIQLIQRQPGGFILLVGFVHRFDQYKGSGLAKGAFLITLNIRVIPVNEGSDQAGCPVVVFADPFCPYCHTFWQQAQPLLKEKHISLKTLLVGVLRPDSGRYAAAVLASGNPASAWQAHQASKGKNKPTLPEKTSQAAFKQIQYNQSLMDQLGANGTPAIYYLNKDKSLQQIVGLPNTEQMARLAACE